jgi:hypothetical protein
VKFNEIIEKYIGDLSENDKNKMKYHNFLETWVEVYELLNSKDEIE